MRYLLFFFIGMFVSTNAFTYAQGKFKLFDYKNKKDEYDSVGKHIVFNERLVIFSDVGLMLSPFFINFRDTLNVKRALDYRINHGVVFGLGFSYKGIGVRLSYMAIQNMENIEKYGETNYFGLQARIPIRSLYLEFIGYRFNGYAISNAEKYIPNFPLPTFIRKNTTNLFTELAGSYFFNRNFNIQSVIGRSGHYTEKQYSFYLKPSVGYYKITNGKNPIIPVELLDKMSINQNNSNKFGSGYVGFIPGIAYVTRLKNWQFSGIVGLGASIQYKFYRIDDYSRKFLGIAPKLDVQIDAGYNPDNWFLMLSNELKFSQLSFSHLLYNGLYYNFRLTGGYRFKLKKKHNPAQK